MNKLQEILDDLEKEAQAKKVIISNTYNNQPELISISSDSAITSTQNQTNDAYYSFTINLQRPALGVKTIQLLKANIPQATALSFTNGELLFPYYRIKTQENIATYDYFTEEPNINNLYYVRLLPSYYPPNIIPNSQLYGFNKTFNNYLELSTELVKACANDLLYTNGFSGNHFIPNDVLISYNSDFNKFQMQGNNTTTDWTPPTWVAGSYAINTIVRYTGTNFISEIDNNTETPSVPYTILPWNGAIQYNAKDIVSYAGINYTARGGSVNAVPPNNLGVYWIYSEWDPNYDYALFGGDGFGTPVTYGGIVYTSAVTSTQNQGNRPDISPAFWTSTLTNWLVYTGALGFSYLIAGYDDPNVLTMINTIHIGLDDGANPDFFYTIYGLNNIIGIPKPPVTKGKTLAKRLGFTWNGIYRWPSTNTVAPLQYKQGDSRPLFWNRLRPIPPYEVIIEELGDIPIPNNNPYTATTYIAENFCNLVYTSILSIISNITTASSLDSTARRNLLWLLDMNCGQLGIAYSDAFVDTPLTKINNDIYQINIELRNELDEPFYISNNGISTFLLKLTY